jgi:hypothetical protein
MRRLKGGIKYIALSYAWGDLSDLRTIFVDDCEMQVTASLEGALRHFRALGTQPPIWVDALCINQGDHEERRDQVQQMRSIYESAAQVRIWLGESTPYSELACNFIQQANDLQTDALSREMLNTRRKQSNPQLHSDALEDFFGRPWWNRLWILQEVGVAQNEPLIGCGQTWLPWRSIEELDALIFETQGGSNFRALMDDSGISNAKDLVAIRKRVQNKEILEMSYLLSSTILRQYSDPLDQVYALVGLANVKAQRTVVADYTKDLGSLFLDVARACMETENSLNLLSFVQHMAPPPKVKVPKRNFLERLEAHTLLKELELQLPTNSAWEVRDLAYIQFDSPEREGPGIAKELELPSWVPNWQAFRHRHLLPLYQDGSYHASKGETIEVSFSDDIRSVTITGVRYDSIETISPSDWDPFHILNDISKLEGAALFVRTKYRIQPPEQEDATLENILRALVANRSLAGEVPAPSDFINQLKVSCDRGKIPASFMPEQTYPIDRFMNYTYSAQTRLRQTMEHRRFFVTKGGYCGIGPEHLEEGDEVCVLFGADMLFALRRFHEHWRFLGECYVHGLMEGEAINSCREGSHETSYTKFTIR